MVYLFSDLDPRTSHTPVPLFVDNSGIVSMVFNPVEHQSNKHIRISCHFARELAEEKVIVPQRVTTEDNLADIFTKPLGAVAFKAVVGHYVAPADGKVSTIMDRQDGSVRGGVLAIAN
jgi:hypothetical protein